MNPPCALPPQSDGSPAALWALSKSARHSIEAGLRAEYMNFMGVFMGPITDSILSSPDLGMTVSAAVSNGGLAPKSDGYGPWRLVAVRPVVNMAFARYPTVLVETAAGHLTVTVLGPARYIADEDATALLREVMAALGDMVGSATLSTDADGLVTTLDVTA